ncbi:MAG: cyclase family protein [Elusimicrobia bacterium]|nr:cyclase family protein [Elusimicrobiota bacterium]
MAWIDITARLAPGMPAYNRDPLFRFRWVRRIGGKHRCNLSTIVMASHCGTHIDAPLHFFKNKRSVDEIPVEQMIGSCRVVDVLNPKIILPADLPEAKAPERLIFKTTNTARSLMRRKQFVKDFAALSAETALELVRRRVKLVGIDYLSIEPFGSIEPAVHRTLLEAGVVILEGLDLTGVQAGDYELVCLPLKVPGAEGAPARAVLREISLL